MKKAMEETTKKTLIQQLTIIQTPEELDDIINLSDFIIDNLPANQEAPPAFHVLCRIIKEYEDANISEPGGILPISPESIEGLQPFQDGYKSKGICYKCKDIVNTTFRASAFCDICDKLVSIAPKKEQESRENKNKTATEVMIEQEALCGPGLSIAGSINHKENQAKYNEYLKYLTDTMCAEKNKDKNIFFGEIQKYGGPVPRLIPGQWVCHVGRCNFFSIRNSPANLQSYAYCVGIRSILEETNGPGLYYKAECCKNKDTPGARLK